MFIYIYMYINRVYFRTIWLLKPRAALHNKIIYKDGCQCEQRGAAKCCGSKYQHSASALQALCIKGWHTKVPSWCEVVFFLLKSNRYLSGYLYRLLFRCSKYIPETLLFISGGFWQILLPKQFLLSSQLVYDSFISDTYSCMFWCCPPSTTL